MVRRRGLSLADEELHEHAVRHLGHAVRDRAEQVWRRDVCLCRVLCWCHRFSARRAADWGPVETGPSGRSVLSVTRGGGSAMAVT